MIQNQENRVSNTFGYNQQTGITIPESSMNYIVELLSSNLYNEPMQSFLRESISNAIDANIENNTQQNPIIINLSAKGDYIEISDSGIGINPQRFKDIYLQLGSSTKRADNQQIGGFGLGRLSALACSNNVFIDTIYYDDTTQKYIRDVYNMYKPNVGIQIENIIHNSDCDKHKTGTTVRIYTTVTYQKESYIRQYIIGLFPKLYKDKKIEINSGTEAKFYDPDIKYYKEFDNFTIIDADINSLESVFIGNIHYKDVKNTFHTSIDYLKPETRYEPYHSIPHLHLIPKLNIGDVSFTPSRDSLRYDDATVQTINDLSNKVAYEVLSKLVDYEFKSLDFLKDPNNALRRYLLNSRINIKKDVIVTKEFPYNNVSKFRISIDNASRGLIYNKFKCLTCNILPHEPTPKIAFLDCDNILDYIFKNNANIVLTNRVLNEPFCKEKSNLIKPTIFIDIKKYKKEDFHDRKYLHTLLSNLMRYLPEDVIKFESKADFDYVKGKSRRANSDVLKIQFLENSDKANYNTYNTKLSDEYITVDTTKEYPIILAENLDTSGCITLRYLYRFYKSLSHDYATKLFPKEIRFGICSTTSLLKLTTEGKAISLNSYLSQNSLTVNIIRLVNKHIKAFHCMRRPNAELVRFLYKIYEIKNVDNIIMLSNIAVNAPMMCNSAVYDYIDCNQLDYKKFNDILPLLKDLIYNKCVLSLYQHELVKYYIPKFSHIKLTNYGR
ncbi:MAG: ATP-binding protein [Bacilli bacterium]|nr:ATP-binding protein [Bacilli bacterium]